jgi:ABC-type antimicrobial peptide transport system permease subunit
MTLLLAFATIGIALGAVGVYGVVAYAVSQRTHEIGVRIALGARGLHVVTLVVGQSMRFAIAGVALGSILALAGARWIQPLLFRQSATDPVVLIAVGALILVVAMLASTVPAIRAMRADPNTVLRVE